MKKLNKKQEKWETIENSYMSVYIKFSLDREENTTLQKTLVKRFKTLARQKIATMAP